MTASHAENDNRTSMLVSGILSVAGRYDSFVFDQFGVMHNNSVLYPNVVNVLQALKDQGKAVHVLSNSGRSGKSNHDRIVALGVPDNLIGDVVTSGDVARDRVLPGYVRKFGSRCHLLSSPNESTAEVIAVAPGLEAVSSVTDCDFVYLSGMPEGLSETWKTGLLPEMLAAKVPLLCSNPDFVNPARDGLATSAGTIARAFREAGGTVELVGKPRPLVYEVLRQKLAATGHSTTLFVGDSYDHDIRGARRAGFDAFQVMTGVHEHLFAKGDPVQVLEQELVRDGIRPTWLSPTL